MSAANPFVGYGTVASGGRFVGREAEIAALRSRLYEARSSAALIGLTRMGKSSLANKIISEPPDARTAAGWVNIATAQSGAEVFADILAMCPAPEALHVTFTTAGSAAGAQDVPIHGLYRMIRDALLRLRRTGGHLVVVLDEFDSIRHFPDAREFLNLLRELVYFPDRIPMAALAVARGRSTVSRSKPPTSRRSRAWSTRCTCGRWSTSRSGPWRRAALSWRPTLPIPPGSTRRGIRSCRRSRSAAWSSTGRPISGGSSSPT